MPDGALTGYIDVAQVVLYVFWAFFAGLIFYLRREDRREGYPLESEVTGKPLDPGIIWIPEPKVFRMRDGHTVEAPNGQGDQRPIHATPIAPWPGAPLEPSGNPMLDGVGPGSYAERADHPDMTAEGELKIVPLRAASGFYVEERDPDPRGMQVIGADDWVAGRVTDVWVDRAEYIIRYLEVEVSGGEAPRHVLLPINFTRISGSRRQVRVSAIMAAHFADVPALKNPEQVTLLEEERIMAYYGGGYLYADPQRAEPFL